MRLSLRGLTRHWKLKLTSLGLAVLLWVVVSAEQPATQWIRVRVEPVLRDPDYVLTGGAQPGSVLVRFSGRGRELWEVALREPVLFLPIRNGGAGSYALDPQMVQVPRNLPGVTAEDVRPGLVRVELQRLAVKDVPVRPTLGRRSIAEYVIGRDVRVIPATVRIAGPAEAVAEVDSLFTEPIEVRAGDTAGFTRRVAIDTTGLDAISVSAPVVRVTATVARRAERTFAVVPVELPTGIESRTRQVEVRVTGAGRVVDGLSSASLHAAVPRDSLPAAVPSGGVDAPVVVTGLPAGVTARPSPDRIHVTGTPLLPGSALAAPAPPLLVPRGALAPGAAPRQPLTPGPAASPRSPVAPGGALAPRTLVPPRPDSVRALPPPRAPAGGARPR